MTNNNDGTPNINVDPQIKAYIDEACQKTITVLVDKVKEMINQQVQNQQQWNEQLEQANWTGTERQFNNNQHTEEDLTSPATVNSTDTRETTHQDNYPPTPALNELIENMMPLETTTQTKNKCMNRDNLEQIDRPLVIKNKKQKQRGMRARRFVSTGTEDTAMTKGSVVSNTSS
ncbi:6016_t:CDS:2 [Dentiscutata erythropus]|uniref:6016_t:CDS:1 n=1 Tax=Dentiscutata erythropus TaxID=1348616 RepID=A0A9N9DC79_9GLOM|nr:6016_t:CDS:2 [Dentiscutata erythropus]